MDLIGEQGRGRGLQAGFGMSADAGVVSPQLSAALPPRLVTSGPAQPQMSSRKPQHNREMLFGLGLGGLCDRQYAWDLGSLGW